jgi:ATP-binding cassette subfamily B protein
LSKQDVSAWKFTLKLARYKFGIFLASGLFASVMFYIIPLLPGLVLRGFFDALAGATAGSDQQIIYNLIGLLVVIALVRVATLILANVVESTLQFFVNTLLQRNMLAQILQQPGARSLPYSSGEAISRFRDDVQAVSAFLSWLMDPIGQAIGLTVGVIVLYQISPIITLAIFVPLALVVIVLRWAASRIQGYRRAAQASIGGVTGLIGDLFNSITAVKLAGAESSVVDHLETLNEVRRKATLRDTIFSEFISTVSFNMGSLGTGVLLLAGAGALASNQFTLGDFALFVSYIEWLTIITGMFGNFLARYRQVTVSFERMLVLMEGAPPEKLVAHHPTYLIGSQPKLPTRQLTTPLLSRLAVENLTFVHPDTGRGIRQASFELSAGTLTVVTGQIGSGKTTLLRALLGLLPAEGRVYWNGEWIVETAGFLVPPRTAYTPQIPRLFSESLRDNILMGMPEGSNGQNRIDPAIRAAVLETDLQTLDQGLETMVGPRGVKLSGGQRQRTAAARMFARQPALYVFDDLSSALDVDTERILWERMFQTEPRPTVLAVSHRRRVLRQADQIILLEKGRIADIGRFDDLANKLPEN